MESLVTFPPSRGHASKVSGLPRLLAALGVLRRILQAWSLDPKEPMNASQHVEVRQRSSNGIGTASLVLDILACLVSWIPFLGILGIPVAIIGIILAIK